MWEVKKYNNPWPYLIIDNFFDEEHWEYISYNLVKNPGSYVKQYKDCVEKNRTGYQFNDIKDKKLNTYFKKVIPESFIQDNFNNFRQYEAPLTPFTSIKYCHIPITFSTHFEETGKVLSCVVYISPTHNVGTVIFDKDKVFNSVVIWKPNRALIFAAIDEVTWHAFGNWEQDKRVTIDYFLYR